MSSEDYTEPIAAPLVQWQKQFGRHALPWMVRDPYRRWLSEIMLQQTQVSVVVDYFERFVQAFPRVDLLAAATVDEVMPLWAGLGYYSRARNLHACACQIVQTYQGQFPQTPEQLSALPGIGRSTAGAIASFSFDCRAAILDGNVKRVLTRLSAHAGVLGTAASDRVLWAMAERLLPETQVGVYNQGLMDLGALVCTRTQPDCERCPLRRFCRAASQGNPTDYPVRKPRTARPERHVHLVMYRQGQALWLEQRTAKAVWQGLLSLPECSAPQGCFVAHFTHDFSHYRLQADVYTVPWTGDQPPTAQGRWALPEQLDRLALPAPVRKLLLTYAAAASDGF